MIRRNRLNVYLHLVWTTWDRLPLITPEMEPELFRHFGATLHSLKCRPLAINGMSEHVHVFLAMSSTVAIANLVQKLKGSSSHFVNDQLHPSYKFKWAGYYGAFSVSRWDVQRIVTYIQNQKQHHADDALELDLEEAFEFADPKPRKG